MPDSAWLKFNYKGKTLYVSKLPARYNLSWGVVYEKGALYGSGLSTDLKPTGESKTVAQTARVVIGSNTYIVRVLSGSPTNPTPTLVTGTLDPAALVPCEWNDLFYPIVNDPAITTYSGPKISNPYALSDLGFGSTGNGRASIVKEIVGTNNTLNRGLGTSTDVNFAAWSFSNTNWGWRPCLELVTS